MKVRDKYARQINMNLGMIVVLYSVNVVGDGYNNGNDDGNDQY